MISQVLLAAIIAASVSANVQDFLRKPNNNNDNIVAEIQVLCHGDSILLRMNTNKPFNGMIYPKGLFDSNSCISEYNSAMNMTYKLPLRSCNTLSSEVDGGVEYFNTIVVQPHHRLLTNQGRGYHIRCKYQTEERTMANHKFNVSSSFAIQNSVSNAVPILAVASMPTCTMKIYNTRAADNNAANSNNNNNRNDVKVGDKLLMVIRIDQQEMYGIRVSNCIVRDGINLAEQTLINDKGCPIDENIMPQFDYTMNYTRASVVFPAHKFPHTSSIYYQCTVSLCIKDSGSCDSSDCRSSAGTRSKRFVSHDEFETRTDHPIAPALTRQNNLTMSFDVYSNLLVNDAADASVIGDEQPQQEPFGLYETPWLCLTRGQTSFVVLLAAISTIGAVAMFTCQIGSGTCANDNNDGHSSLSSSLPTSQCMQQQASHHQNPSANNRHHYRLSGANAAYRPYAK